MREGRSRLYAIDRAVGQLLGRCPTIFLERLLNAPAVAGLAGTQTLCLPQVTAGLIQQVLGDETIHGVVVVNFLHLSPWSAYTVRAALRA